MNFNEAKQYVGATMLHDFTTQLPDVLRIYRNQVFKETLVTVAKVDVGRVPFVICLERREQLIRVMVKNAQVLSNEHPDLHSEVWEIIDVDNVTDVEEVMNTLYRCFDKLFDEQLTLNKLQSYSKFMIDNVSIRQHPIKSNFFTEFLGKRVMGEYELMPNRKVSFIVKEGFFFSKPSAVFRFEEVDITGRLRVIETTRSEVYRYVTNNTSE
ncbi:hypothetical protein [Vibrio phage VP4B]|uniref:Uncharacterized protein n=1 Tax=Vibrio phage VP4B TaxID=1262540 RepID=V9M008_9CAUD|nr:hypothetical protein FDJ61_gp057 [Vibrio phage VP4B]AGB07171.1 hypothetical protein [Vibrio phage VP4B]